MLAKIICQFQFELPSFRTRISKLLPLHQKEMIITLRKN